MRMALDIAKGMEYLHENGYIHGDLALRNCLIETDGNVKVGDLGSYEDGHKDLYFSDSVNTNLVKHRWGQYLDLFTCFIKCAENEWINTVPGSLDGSRESSIYVQQEVKVSAEAAYKEL